MSKVVFRKVSSFGRVRGQRSTSRSTKKYFVFDQKVNVSGRWILSGRVCKSNFLVVSNVHWYQPIDGTEMVYFDRRDNLE